MRLGCIRDPFLTAASRPGCDRPVLAFALITNAAVTIYSAVRAVDKAV